MNDIMYGIKEICPKCGEKEFMSLNSTDKCCRNCCVHIRYLNGHNLIHINDFALEGKLSREQKERENKETSECYERDKIGYIIVLSIVLIIIILALIILVLTNFQPF